MHISLCKHTSSAGARGPAARPIEKLPPWVTAWERLLPVIRVHTLLAWSYSTQKKPMKRTDFSRQFDQPDLNFQKILYIG